MAKRQPRAIAEAEAAIVEQQSLADAAMRQEAARLQQNGQVPNTEANAVQTTLEQPTDTQIQVVTDPKPDDLVAAKKEIDDLKAQIKVLQEEHKTATEQAAYFKQRWDSLAGIHKAQVTDVRQQNEALVARVAELEQVVKNNPQTDEDMAAVKRSLGDRADEYTEEALRDMATNRRLAREAAESGFGSKMRGLEAELAKLRNAGTQAKSTGFWEKVEQARAGFDRARNDFGSGYEMWFAEVNPDSADGLTRQQCMDAFAKLGLVDKAVAMVDEFARVTGHKFVKSSDSSERPIDVPALAVKPDTRQAPVPSTKQDTSTAVAPKPRFPEAFAQEFASKWARSKHAPFRAFQFKQSGKTVTIQTRAQAEKLAKDCEDALLEGRTY